MNSERVKNIVTIVFFGALGSGLWSLVGDATEGFIYNSVILAGGWVGQTFGDSMNLNIGTGGWGDRSSAMLLIIVLWVYNIFMLSHIFKLKNPYFIGVAVVTIFIILTFASYKITYSLKMELYFNQSIEILAPHIADQELLLLRQKYRYIDSLESLGKAQQYIDLLSNKYEVQIREFSL